MWIDPKLNWNKDDYYNFDDLNRVENNTEVVAELVGYFVTLPTLNFITDRDMSSIDFADSLNRVEGNIDVLGQRHKPEGWIQNKTDWSANDPFSFSDAVRLESNLALLYSYYKSNLANFNYCGAFTCGEELV
ncbi:hypothetical protein BK138_16065 [Paenibacillus rhizosphaerae]|uniref:Uncharacterized protein n=1 Tax=Paenibacillus rhizosphaerae TaxID=297318 RepID=A0A1R1ES36_9BACL|nr:hypothetical protein [Paenibacillus rhizosphaerae]OMF54673.1 hypothetical protein BK138_16065 [Paenibacillus rhizosphaerae]